MFRQTEPFIVALARTMRARWKLFFAWVVISLMAVVIVVSMLPPRYMAVGLVRVGFVGPGFGMLDLNTVATEAGSTGFIEKVKKKSGVADGDMIARVRFQSNLVELRAFAGTPEKATTMVQTASDFMIQEHNEMIRDVFAGAKALYLERFGKVPLTEETIFQRDSMAMEMVEEVKSVKPGLVPAALLAVFLGILLGVVAVVLREMMVVDEAS